MTTVAGGCTTILGAVLALACASPCAQSSSASRSAGPGAWSEPQPEIAAEFGALARARAQGLVTVAPPRLALLSAWFIAAGDPSGEPPAETEAMVQHILRAGVADAMVWWMFLDLCPAVGNACALRGAEAMQRLRDLEPDNAAAWVRNLESHAQPPDAAAARGRIERAATAKYFDDHRREWVQVLRELYEGIDVPDSHAVAYSTGVGREIARYSQLDGMLRHLGSNWSVATTEQCGVGAAAAVGENARDACGRVFALMAESTSLDWRRTGLRNLLAMSVGTPEQPAAARRYLDQLWLDSHWAVLSQGKDSDEEVVAFFASEIEHGELASHQRLLARNNVSSVAPRGWLPERVGRDERAWLGIPE